MDKNDMKARTRQFAIDMVQFVETLPRGRAADVLGRQILRSGTSIGANYRAACRAKSRADFISKLGIVEEEADETQFWFEVILGAKLVSNNEIEYLYKEAGEILAITVASIKTARNNKGK